MPGAPYFSDRIWKTTWREASIPLGEPATAAACIVLRSAASRRRTVSTLQRAVCSNRAAHDEPFTDLASGYAAATSGSNRTTLTPDRYCSEYLPRAPAVLALSTLRDQVSSCVVFSCRLALRALITPDRSPLAVCTTSGNRCRADVETRFVCGMVRVRYCDREEITDTRCLRMLAVAFLLSHSEVNAIGDRLSAHERLITLAFSGRSPRRFEPR